MKLLTGILLICIALASCSHDAHVDAVLAEADSLIFVQPDSARSLLDSIDVAAASKSRRARHALLLTKAREKSKVIVTDDSLVSVAVDFYRGKGDSLEVQSLFYKGVILSHKRDYSNALISLMEAADRAAENDDYFYLAMAYREQADIFSHLYDESNSARLSALAARNFALAEKPLHALREKFLQAQSLILLDDIPNGLKILSELRRDSNLKINSYAALYHRVMSDAAYARKDYRQALAHIDSIEIYAKKLSSIQYSKKAKAASALGQLDLSEKYLTEAQNLARTSNDTSNLLYSRSKLYAAEGDFERSYKTFMKFYNRQTVYHNDLLSHPYTTPLVNYLDDRSALLHQKFVTERKFTWTFVVTSCLLVVIIICLINIYKFRTKIRNERTEVLLYDLSRFQKQVSELQIQLENTHPDKEIKQILNHPFLQFSNNILETLVSYSNSEGGYQSLGKQMSKLAATVQKTEFYTTLEDYINITHNNLMTRFRDQFGQMPNKKYYVATLVFASFSNQFMSMALGYNNTASVRSLRSRLKSEIVASDAPDKEEFLSYFG